MPSKNHKRHRLPVRELTTRLPADWIPFKRTTAELKSFKGLIGQDRAMRAVEVGLKIPTRGFNIYVAGEPGSGKTSTLVRLLTSRAAKEATPPDVCYVHNFSSPNQPQPILLPAGKGRLFAKAMDRVVEELSRMIPRVLSAQSFGHIRSKILADTHTRAKRLTRKASAAAKALDLAIEEGEQTLRVLPLVDGEPVTDPDVYQRLSAARRRKIEAAMLAFQKHLDTYSYHRQQLEIHHSERLTRAESTALEPLVTELVRDLAGEFRGLADELDRYLDGLVGHVVEHYHAFYDPAGEEDGEEEEGEGVDTFNVYRVNVLVDRTDEKGAPVVMEQLPSAANLCGCFEYRTEAGRLMTDHTMIRAGCLHRANGGYVLLQVDDLLAQTGAWECLKRALRHKQIRIEEEAASDERRTRLAGAMRPDPVTLGVKVVLVGSREAYYTLCYEDEDFGRLFKVLAEFDHTMPRNRKNVGRMARFLGQVCREEGYLPLHRSGLMRLVEIASRLAEHKERMITQWAPLLDQIAEANFYAAERRARAIHDSDFDRAVAEQQRRSGAASAAVDRAIADGTIFIRTRGQVVGQINGIALYDLGGFSFGVPVRITVRVYAGRRGVVNIDREVNLSGAIHDKGALILVGYLGGRYAQEQTLGLSASITFEQSYDEIDGDSASCAELYALLSALSGCPIRQGIAVTGSVNQVGEVQPIGGVNEKIEGIFRICKRMGGLTGEQGVMIPRANIRHLMLEREVIDAVRAGTFHIYAISTVDEGIEVLTGVPAGRWRGGRWTQGSLNERVDSRFKELQEIIRRGGVTTALDEPI
jgi:predicted ATP-dependent protease